MLANVSRRQFLKNSLATSGMLLLSSCGSLESAVRAADGKQPNIVLLLADDLGWTDVSYQKDKFETPHIDQLAAEGMVFSDAYVDVPTCSPARAALLTGKHPVRLSLVRHIGADSVDHHAPDKYGRHTEEYHLRKSDPAQMKSRNWLPLEEKTIGDRLKTLGYRTCFVGKWHLGHEPYHPIHHGFDEQHGVSNFGGPFSYFAPYFRGRSETYKDVPEGKYLTDQLTDDAVSFIQKQKPTDPFLLTLFYYNPHAPFQAKKELIEKFKSKGLRGKEARKAAMIASVDESVLRIRTELKKKGLADNTVIFFGGDNGSSVSQAPLRGGKKNWKALYEGMARIPYMIYWPGVIEPGSTCDTPVLISDVCPTMLDIASGKQTKHPELDGKSLVPLLSKQGDIKRDAIYIYRAYEGQYAAVRMGDWKIVAYRDGHCELYNLKDDIGEKNDMAKKMPQKAAQMKNKLSAWEKEMGVYYPKEAQ